MQRTGLGRRALVLLGAGLLAGCAGGGLWPFGGSGNRTPEAVSLSSSRASQAAPVDAKVLLPALRFAAAEPGRQGVILRVEGIAPTQGFHSGELRPVGRSADGIETVELRAVAPLGNQAIGAERTRLLAVGRFYSNRDMDTIRGFRIVTDGAVVPATLP